MRIHTPKVQGGFLFNRAALKFEVRNVFAWTVNLIATNRDYFTGCHIESSTVYFSTAVHKV